MPDKDIDKTVDFDESGEMMFFKSVCEANDGLVTYIEPWKDETLAREYEAKDCETVSIVWWNNDTDTDTDADDS